MTNQPNARLFGLYILVLREPRLRLFRAEGFRLEVVFLDFFLVTFF
jgi:hypothetical protein